MSDQGHGGNGQDGPPEWKQPNNGQQPGPGGQYGPPSGGDPQHPTEQFPGQPYSGQQYPTEQFPGQPYGGQQYPTEQFPGQPYGEPQYPGQHPTGQYDPHFNPYSGAAPANTGKSQKGIFIALAAVVTAGLVVLVLALTGVFSGDDTTSDTPRNAAEKVLLASKNQDLGAVKSGLCKKDRADPEIADIVGEDHALKYTIGKVEQKGSDRATVTATVTTKDKTDTADIPVIKEDGSWKVCFSEGDFGITPASISVPSPSFSIPRPSFTVPSIPSLPSITIPSISVPSIPTSFCASSTSASATARLFVSGITIKSLNIAQGCVYQGRVSTSQLEALISSGGVYSPYIAAGDEGPIFTFKSVTGSTTLKVRVEKQSDGKYYVVDASDS